LIGKIGEGKREKRRIDGRERWPGEERGEKKGEERGEKRGEK
jgi:hypothetical protein